MKLIIAKIAESDEELDLNNLIEKLKGSDDRYEIGGIAVFLGTVKGLVDDGGKVLELDYESVKEAAEESLNKIAEEEKEKWGLRAVAILHRVGKLKPGQPTFLVVVAGRGRKEVFPALEEIVERVKKEVPIFKLEKREDGDYWIVGERRRVKREKK
jgi:molybdopterin synthase catalytic subunit